jgi:hypothetical protein
VLRAKKNDGRASILASLLLGVLIGAALVVMPHAVPVAPSKPTAGPSFYFILNENGSSQFPGSDTYNLSFVSLAPGNVTAEWVQFMVYAPAPLTAVNIAVRLLSGDGAILAVFNSTQSTWKGVAAGGNLTLPSMGGWKLGADPNVLETDQFQVVSSQPLNNRQLEVAMSLATSPHYGAWQVLTL